MGRIYSTGFETGDKGDVYVASTDSAVLCLTTTGTYSPFTGNYMLRCTNAVSAQIGPSISSTEIYGHFVFKKATMTSLDAVADVVTNTAAELVQLFVTASGNIAAYRGATATLLQTSTGTLSTNTWYHCEFRFYINNTSGSFQVFIDGQNWINFTGDTQPSTADTISAFRLRGSDGATGFNFFDDLVLNSPLGTGSSSVTSYPGQVRLFPIFPNAVGDVTQLNVSGSASNWDAVNDAPPSADKYVWSSTSGTYDLYNMQNVSITTGTVINGIIAIANSAYDSGAGGIENVIKSGGIEVFNTSQTLSSTYRPYQMAIEKDPNGNVAWNETSINALQVGEKST